MHLHLNLKPERGLVSGPGSVLNTMPIKIVRFIFLGIAAFAWISQLINPLQDIAEPVYWTLGVGVLWLVAEIGNHYYTKPR